MNEDSESAWPCYLLKGNIPFGEQIKAANTLYEIAEDVNLTGNFVMPEGCTLIFCGGMIRGNGRLEGTNTRIIAKAVRIFDEELEICGKWETIEAYGEWFGGNISCNDNSVPMQKCIDAFNMITLNTGTYKTTKTININNNGCVISGVSRYRSKIEKHALMGESINAIIKINSTAERNLQHITIRDLTLSSKAYNVDYGIYTQGINSSDFRNMIIFQCKNGFYCDNTTHGALWNLTFDNVEFNCNTLRGFRNSNPYGYKDGESCAVTCVTNGGASVTFNKCWARDCYTGYHIKGLTYSQMHNCGADNINGTAYLIEYCRMHLNCCGMENLLTSAAMILYQSDIVLTSFADYKMIAKDKGEIYRVKIDGGRTTFTNCFFTEWINERNNPHVYGVTSNNGSKVLMINTEQLKKINKYMPLTSGATLKFVGMD